MWRSPACECDVYVFVDFPLILLIISSGSFARVSPRFLWEFGLKAAWHVQPGVGVYPTKPG